MQSNTSFAIYAPYSAVTATGGALKPVLMCGSGPPASVMMI
jgi:hypothetical protein